MDKEQIRLAMQLYNHYYSNLTEEYIKVKVEDFASLEDRGEIMKAIKVWAEMIEDQMIEW